jgi:hypothetical protein
MSMATEMIVTILFDYCNCVLFYWVLNRRLLPDDNVLSPKHIRASIVCEMLVV